MFSRPLLILFLFMTILIFCLFRALIVKKNKIRREIKILQTLQHGTNIVDMIDVVRDPLTKTPAIITEFVDTSDTDFRKLY